MEPNQWKKRPMGTVSKHAQGSSNRGRKEFKCGGQVDEQMDLVEMY